MAIDPQPSCSSLIKRNVCLNFETNVDSVAVIEGYVDSKHSQALLRFPGKREGTFAVLNSTANILDVNSVVLESG